MATTIPTEPIGSVPRPDYLIEAMVAHGAGRLDDAELGRAMERAVAETIAAMEATGSPIVTDGEQSKPSFATYPLAGLATLSPDGVVIPFDDGHTRQLPVLTAGPFRYTTYSGIYVAAAKAHTGRPVKQAVIAPSAISLIYPQDGIEGYSRDAFLADLVNECEKDIRSAFDARADSVQIDFTEGRLCCKLDPSRAGCCATSWRSTTKCSRASPTPSAPASACIPARAATRIRRIPPTSTTRSCCPTCSPSMPGASSCRWRARRTDRGRWTSSRANDGPGRQSMSESPIPSTHVSRPPGRYASASWKRRSTSALRDSAAPTIAASRRLATMCRPHERPHSPRSGLGSRARSLRKHASADGPSSNRMRVESKFGVFGRSDGGHARITTSDRRPSFVLRRSQA